MVDTALERLVELLDSASTTELVVAGLGIFALLFVVVLVHELGHAAVALARTDGLVLVHVGRSPGLVRVRVGRLDLTLDPRPGDEDEAGWALVVADMSRYEAVAYALAGPAANLGLTLLLAPPLVMLSGTAAYAVGAVVVLSLVVGLWNLVTPQPGSDGRHALAALRGDPVEGDSFVYGERADAVGKWMALFSDRRDSRFSDQRAFLFGLAPVELGVDILTETDEALKYWTAARAGWCWREVSPTEATTLDSTPLRAWRSRALEGLTGLELAGAAAAELARADANGDLERAFLATTELREAATPDERSRFAFHYGAALHDVERVMAEHDQRYW